MTSHSFRLRRRGDGGTNAPPPEECENIIIYVTVTVITIAANAGIAIATFARARFLTSSFGEVSIPDSRLPVLAALQAAGAAGLLLGLLGVPIIGMAAAVGLVLFFIGAVVTHLRARAYRSIPSPAVFLALATATLAFMLV